MDPNATLELAREALERGDQRSAAMHYANLDDWIRKGGFLPDSWAKGDPVPKGWDHV